MSKPSRWAAALLVVIGLAALWPIRADEGQLATDYKSSLPDEKPIPRIPGIGQDNQPAFTRDYDVRALVGASSDHIEAPPPPPPGRPKELRWDDEAEDEDDTPAEDPSVAERRFLLTGRTASAATEETRWERSARSEAEQRPAKDLVRFITAAIQPNSWTPPADAWASVTAGRLTVRQTAAVQDDIAKFLDLMAHPAKPDYRPDVPPALAGKLAKPIPRLTFDRIPLGKAIAELESRTGIRIQVDWPALEEIGVIEQGALSLDVQDILPERAVSEVLTAAIGKPGVAACDLRRDGLFVAPDEEIRKNFTLRVYDLKDVHDLLTETTGGPLGTTVLRYSLTAWGIRGIVDPGKWNPEGPNACAVIGDRLAVLQSRAGHREIADLLNRLLRAGKSFRVALADEQADANPLPAARRRLGPVRFDKTPADQAVAELRKRSGVPIKVDWDALKAMGVMKPDRITLDLVDPTLEEAVQAFAAVVTGHAPEKGLLGELRDTPMCCLITPNGVRITTYWDPDGQTRIRVYNVRDLANGLCHADYPRQFLDLLRSCVTPESWAPTGPADLAEIAGLLIVRQTPSGHRQLAEFLDMLRHLPRPGQTEAEVLRLDDRGEDGGRTIDAVDFDGVPFSRALELLDRLSDWPIVANWAAMEALGITRNTELTVHLRDLPLGAALRAVLAKTAGRYDVLDYLQFDGRIVVSSKDDLDKLTTIRPYDVSDLLEVESKFNALPAFLELVRATVVPESWAPSGPADIKEVAGCLVVKQTGHGHRVLAGLLQGLRAARADKLAGFHHPGQLDPAEREVALAGAKRVTLAEAMDALAPQTEHGVFVNWGALEGVGVLKTTPVDPPAGAMPLSQMLRRLFDSAGGKPGVLAFAFREEGLVVSAADDLNYVTELKIYNVREILDSLAAAVVTEWKPDEPDVGGGGLFGPHGLFADDEDQAPTGQAAMGLNLLLGYLRSEVQPENWAPTGPADMKEDCTGLLIIKHTWRGQREVEAALERVRADPAGQLNAWRERNRVESEAWEAEARRAEQAAEAAAEAAASELRQRTGDKAQPAAPADGVPRPFGG